MRLHCNVSSLNTFACDVTAQLAPSPPFCWGFLSHTITHIHPPVRTTLNEWSTRRRDRYLHNTGDEHLSMPLAGFDHTISAIKRPQTYHLEPHVHLDRHSNTCQTLCFKLVNPCRLITDILLKCRCPQFYPHALQRSTCGLLLATGLSENIAAAETSWILEEGSSCYVVLIILYLFLKCLLCTRICYWCCVT